MSRIYRWAGVVAVGLWASVLTASSRAADFTEPKDGVFTEKQLAAYLQVQKEALDSLKAAGKAVDGNASGAAAVAVYLRTNEKLKASLAKHGLSEGEYAWVGGQVWGAWSELLQARIVENMQKSVADQKKATQAKVDELSQKLAAYEKAQKAGRRVMTADERKAAIESAQSDRQSALDEAKQHADEAKQAHDDAAKADAEAKAADAAAKNPPSDVSDDDKPGFIDQKKSDAQTARDTAKEAREKEAEAKKAEAESRAKAELAGKRVTDPDLPTTDDEKAEVKKQNDEQIASLKSDIDATQQGVKLLEESSADLVKNMQSRDPRDKQPAQNVALLKKHLKEFEDVWGFKEDQLFK